MTINLVEQDKQHRSLALDATKSFIVQAPAGSGKTELLIQRFLTLLTRVNAPEEILAITFTKKSANEMRLRVIKALKQGAYDKEPESAHAKKTWHLAQQVLLRDKNLKWHLISNPNQLRIQTIDSLCSYITKQLPLLSHFGSSPDIALNPSHLYRKAVQEILMHVEENYAWSQAISQLLLHLDNDLNKCHDLLVSLLAKRDQWLSYIQFNSSDTEIKAFLENQLQAVINECIVALDEIFPHPLSTEILDIARYAASHIEEDEDIRACQNLVHLPRTTHEDLSAWRGIAKILLTKSFSWRKRVDESIGFIPLKNLKNPQEKALNTEFRQRLTTLINNLSDNESLRLALQELFHLPNPYYQENQWEILQSLLHVLKIVAAQLRVTFQEYGQIDFIENTQGALAALGSDEHPTDLALSLDYQIQHILVDEFQDTSYTQYQLLEKLTQGWEGHDGRTLFIVGDPMQSIYRFREAEVGLFIRMRKNGLRHIPLIPLTLTVNFRSNNNIVEWNNEHFKEMFPNFNDVATGAVSYSPSVSLNANASTNEKIKIRGFVDAPDEVEANYIIDIINETKIKHPDESIAILVRSRPHLSAIMPALKKAKIPYRAIDIDPLASRQTILDLLSLTCALLHPADRIAWLAILRAPWCGLSLADLFIIGNDPNATIYKQIQNSDICAKLSDDGRKRLSKITFLLKNKIEARDRCALRSWIESTWLLLGGPAYLHDYADISDIQAYFHLLDEFSTQDATLSLDKLKERIQQLYASTQHDNANLHIMTIHTAKGLEFDTVILPHLDKKNPSDDKALLSWMERPLANDQNALLLAPIHAIGDEKNATYEYINRQQRIKSDYETDRLFYVATTRAKKRLHIMFNSTRKENLDLKVESGSFLGKIWPKLEKRQTEILVTHTAHLDKNHSEMKPQRFLHRVHSDWENPISELSIPSIASHKKQSGFKLMDNTSQLIGTVTHRLLQQLTRSGIGWWIAKSQEIKSSHLQLKLKQSGMHQQQISSATKHILKYIENMLGDDKGKWILHNHTASQSEYAISTLIDNKLTNLIIDRTFIDEQGTRWIIDYKTTTFSHVDLNDFLENEQEKYLKQMQKYALALKEMGSEPIRLGLYFPAIPAWHEWSI